MHIVTMSAVMAVALAIPSSHAWAARNTGPARVARRASSSSRAKSPRAVKNATTLRRTVTRTTGDARKAIAARSRPPTRKEIQAQRQAQFARAEVLAKKAVALDEAILNHEADHVPSFAATATLLQLRARLDSSRASYSLRTEKNEAAAKRASAQVRRNFALLERGRRGERGKNGYLLGYDAVDPWAPIRKEEADLKQLAENIEYLETVEIPEAEDQLAAARSIPRSPLGDALTHYGMMESGIALRTGRIKIGRGGRWKYTEGTSADLRKAVRGGRLRRGAGSTWSARYGYEEATKPPRTFPRELLMDQRTNRGLAAYSATWGARFDDAFGALTAFDTVLEVGPGYGNAVSDLLEKSGAKVVAVDRGEESRDGKRNAENNLRIARESQGRATYIEGNVLSSTGALDGGKVSMVMDYYSAIATEAPGPLMARYGAVVRTGGHVFLTLPPRDKVWVYPADGGKPTELVDYLARVPGFEMVESGFRVRDASPTREDGVGKIRERYAILRKTSDPVAVRTMRQIGVSTSSVNSSKTSYSNFGRAYMEQ